MIHPLDQPYLFNTTVDTMSVVDVVSFLRLCTINRVYLASSRGTWPSATRPFRQERQWRRACPPPPHTPHIEDVGGSAKVGGKAACTKQVPEMLLA